MVARQVGEFFRQGKVCKKFADVFVTLLHTDRIDIWTAQSEQGV